MSKHTQIVSSIPGRTRFRVPMNHRNEHDINRVASSLQKSAGVHNVEYNVKTGSILVNHEHHAHQLEDIKDVMRDLGVVFADVTGANELISIGGGESEKSLDLPDAVADLNLRLREATNGIIDLRFVLPLALAWLGVFQYMTYGLQFELIPWYVLFYFAIDTFIRLNFSQQAPAN
ncbi:hypothetical protein NIES4071_02350 [Calothrix sp. NIES-4071]|nr:hypothetical protein NIES4071_02350 [Calothrix sp. NIES-4071]BAZ54581.1 hypothetical protein NIES4105_02340 [Calothrix sp. NIES-4105]